MNLKYFIVFVAGMAALAGCQEASEYIPSIYITEVCNGRIRYSSPQARFYSCHR